MEIFQESQPFDLHLAFSVSVSDSGISNLAHSVSVLFLKNSRSNIQKKMTTHWIVFSCTCSDCLITASPLPPSPRPHSFVAVLYIMHTCYIVTYKYISTSVVELIAKFYVCNGVEWSKDRTQAAESIKWRPQLAYGSNHVLLAQPQTIFSTHKILTLMHR